MTYGNIKRLIDQITRMCFTIIQVGEEGLEA